MEDQNEGWVQHLQEQEARRAFRQQTDAWFDARVERFGPPNDAGELEMAKDLVCSWLQCRRWPNVDVHTLDACDLLGQGMFTELPEAIKPERLVTAFVDWIGWLFTCGLFDLPTMLRFVRELEDWREFFVEEFSSHHNASATPEGEATIATFLEWLHGPRQRPEDLFGVDDAVMMAALDTIGRVDGDVSTIDVKRWLDYAALLGFHLPTSPELHCLMRDAIEWFRLQGRLGALDRSRLLRELNEACRCARMEEMIPTPEPLAIEA